MIYPIKSRKSMFSYQILECMCVTFVVCFSFVVGAKLSYNNALPFGILSGLIIYFTISVMTVITLGANGYFSAKERPMPEISTLIFSVVLVMNLVFVALLYFSHAMRLSICFFIITDAIELSALTICKLYFLRVKSGFMAKRKVLVIGQEERKTAIMLAVSRGGDSNICFSDSEDPQLMEYAKKADVLFLAGGLSKKTKDQVISQCLCFEKDIYLVPETYEISLRKSRLIQVGDVPVFNIGTYKLSESQKLIKRIMDICGAIAGMLLTAPLMLAAILCIKCEDGGTVFFKQVRVGRNNKEFEVIKFRSMSVDAEKATGAVFATKNDPRITKVGGFLRATRIDEIPQFINVLKGDMSLVGPRPERPVFVNQFSEEIPEYKNRLAVKPGITGLAQVLGNYTTTAVNKARFDMVYVQEYSLMLDLKILLKTIKVVFTKEQSDGFAAEGQDSSYNIHQGTWLGDLIAGKECKDDKWVEEESTRKVLFSSKSRKSVIQSIIKTAMITGCCLAVIAGSLTFRYVSFAAEAFNLQGRQTWAERELSGNGESDIVSLDGDIAQPVAVTNKGSASLGENIASGQDSTSEPSIEAGGGNLSAGSQEADIVLSEERIEKAMEKITLKDKLEAIVMLVTRLDTDAIMKLEEMSRGGFTVEEKQRAKEMMNEYYDEDEVRKIRQLYLECVG